MPVIDLSSGKRMISNSDLAHRPQGAYNHADDRDFCASFLLAAVTGGHKCGGLNTHLFSYSPGGQKPDVCVTGQKQSVSGATLPLRLLGQMSPGLSSFQSCSPLGSWPRPPSSEPGVWHLPVCRCFGPYVGFSYSLCPDLPLPCSHKDTRHYVT